MILVTFGTRPEYIKVKPLIKVLKENSIEFSILFTGQHVDLLRDVKEDNIRRIEIVDSGTCRLDSIVSSILNKEHIFEGISSVLVQGDTTSAFSVALAAFHRKIKIIHLEAGLRTYDFENPYPEEANRQLISRISDINLCPTDINKNHLLSENVSGKCFVVGNTVLDNLIDIDVDYQEKIIVTLHRRENHALILDWFLEIERLANRYDHIEFILPIHPNPCVSKHSNVFEKVKVVPPMSYEKFIENLSSCKLVITDSGGIQEECSFLRKKAIVCRLTTERSEVVDKFSFLCASPRDLESIFSSHVQDYIPNKEFTCPYGEGKTSESIFEILKGQGYV